MTIHYHRAHWSGKTEEIGWELLQHPPKSTDYASSDLHFSGPLKESLGGIKFENDEDVQQYVWNFLREANIDIQAM